MFVALKSGCYPGTRLPYPTVPQIWVYLTYRVAFHQILYLYYRHIISRSSSHCLLENEGLMTQAKNFLKKAEITKHITPYIWLSLKRSHCFQIVSSISKMRIVCRCMVMRSSSKLCVKFDSSLLPAQVGIVSLGFFNTVGELCC